MTERASVMFTNVDGETCSQCGQPVVKDDAVVVWRDGVYDTLACYQEAVDEWERQTGLDFIASRDQAVAAVQEVLREEPTQFLFVFQPPGEPEAITTTVFAKPDFVMSAVAALVEGVALNEPTVAPPPDDD